MAERAGNLPIVAGGDDDADRACGCEPLREHVSALGGNAPDSSCACAGMAKVVQRAGRERKFEILKVVVFAALLVGLVIALWR